MSDARDSTVRYVQASLASLTSGDLTLDGFRLAMLSVAKGQVAFEPHKVAALNDVTSSVHLLAVWESVRTRGAEAPEVAFVLSTLYRLADLSDHTLNAFDRVVGFYTSHLVGEVLVSTNTDLWPYVHSCGAPNQHQIVLLKKWSSFIADAGLHSTVQPLLQLAVTYPKILDERWHGVL